MAAGGRGWPQRTAPALIGAFFRIKETRLAPKSAEAANFAAAAAKSASAETSAAAKFAATAEFAVP